MKLEKLHIYGYGKFENKEFDLSSFTVLYGENEAGKSTIRSFIKAILFGFPTRGQQRYEPKTGGKYGGAITVQTERYGRIKIERLPKNAAGGVTVYREDGTLGGEEILLELLTGMDASLFESIFSFDIHGLQNIHSVKQEELGNYLFSAGAVGTDALLQLEKKLDREMESLFKPNGRKPIINSALLEMGKLHGALQKWQQKIDTYEKWQIKKKNCEQRLKEIQVEKEQLAQRIKDFETMQTLQPLLIEQQKYEQFLKSLNVFSFPPDGIARYDKLQAERRPIEQQLEVLNKKIEEAQRHVSELNLSLLQQEPFVEECRLQQVSYEAAKQELQLVTASLGHLREDIEELQSRLGLAGDLSFVLQLDTSLARKEAVTESVQKAQRLAEQKRELDERFIDVKEMLEEHEEQVRHLQAQLLSEEERSRYKQMQKAEGLQARQNHRKTDKAKTWNMGILLALIISTAILTVSLLLHETFFALLSLFLFVSVVIVFVVRRQKQPALSKEAQPEYIEARYQLEKDAQMLQLLEREQFKLEQAEKAYERIVAQYEEWEQALFASQRELTLYKEACSLPEGLAHTQLLAAWEGLEKLKQLLKEEKKQAKRKAELHAEIYAFELRVKHLCEMFQVPYSSISIALHRIHEKVKEERQKEQAQRELKQKLAEWSEELNDLRQRGSKLEAECKKLWEGAQAQTEDEFFKKGKEYEEVQKAKKEISFLTTQISILTERLVHIDKEDRSAWTEEYETLLQAEHKKAQSLNEEEGQLQTLLAQCNVEIANLEEGSTYAELLHEWEAKKSQLREYMKKWAAYATAKAVLTKTKAHYHEVRLPRILETAEQYFCYLTNGEYSRLFSPTAEQSFVAERKDGVRFYGYELSQATAEQLYLSLRFALADMFEAQCPLIVDDSFVHFDTERTVRAMALLKKRAANRQVLFFTCHAHILPLFAGEEIVKLEGQREAV
ncbi:MAG: AAA family ATPase [Ectobacillus sp.]